MTPQCRFCQLRTRSARRVDLGGQVSPRRTCYLTTIADLSRACAVTPPLGSAPPKKRRVGRTTTCPARLVPCVGATCVSNGRALLPLAELLANSLRLFIQFPFGDRSYFHSLRGLASELARLESVVCLPRSLTMCSRHSLAKFSFAEFSFHRQR